VDQHRHVTVLPGGPDSRPPVLTLADFPLGSLGGTSMVVYRSGSGRHHFDRQCSALSRSKQPAEEMLILPEGGSLADLALPDAHCDPAGKVGAYLRSARRACEAANRLPSIGGQLEHRPRTATWPWHTRFEDEVDWQAIGQARESRDQLAETGSCGSDPCHRELNEELATLLRATVKNSLDLAERLYEQALSKARSSAGQRAVSRMLAALCVLRGRRPREYAPLYQRFRDTVGVALHAAVLHGNESTTGLADFLEDRYRFNLPQRWLEAMAERGEPVSAMATLREEMGRWVALRDPSLHRPLDTLLRVAGLSGTAYLDGLRAHGEDPVLAIVADYRTPFSPYGAIHEVQWDIFSSALCKLRGERSDEAEVEARVVVVPRLWVDALSDADAPSMGGEYMVLAFDVDHPSRTAATCAAVANALTRSCDAGLLHCRRWAPAVATRVKYESQARTTTSSVLSRRLLRA
jgi:hypothetical protein